MVSLCVLFSLDVITQVTSFGRSTGPRGVKIEIKGPELVKETETAANGL